MLHSRRAWIVGASIACLVVASAAFAQTPAAPAGPPTVRIVDFETNVNPFSARRITHAIDQAEAEGDALVLIRLDTPGGLVVSTETIIKRVLASEVPVVIWVGPAGARAASAGFFMLLSADLAAMAPGTRTGAAATVTMGGENRGDDMGLRKANEDSAALLRSIAARRGGDIEAVQAAIFDAKSYEETVALELGLIDLIVPDLETLLVELDGREVRRFDGTPVTLRTAGATRIETEFGFRHELFELLASPWIAYLLLMGGLLGLYIEFTQPGVVFPGVAGALCLLLFAFAAQALPISAVGILLIVLALVMFLLEIKVTSYGMLSLGGIVSLLLGSMMLIDGPIPELRVPMSLYLPVSLAIAALCIVAVRLAWRAQRERVATGVEGLAGEVGTVIEAIDPQGKVFVHGEIWSAISTSGPLAKGERVRVRSVQSLQLSVEPISRSADA